MRGLGGGINTGLMIGDTITIIVHGIEGIPVSGADTGGGTRMFFFEKHFAFGEAPLAPCRF